MAWVRRPINGVKFKPSEMDAMFRALDLYESNCETVASIHGKAFRKKIGLDDKEPDRREFHGDIARHARKQIKLAASARHKWWRVCLGWSDEYYAEIEARRKEHNDHVTP